MGGQVRCNPEYPATSIIQHEPTYPSLVQAKRLQLNLNRKKVQKGKNLWALSPTKPPTKSAFPQQPKQATN